jgi:hypothetical protein
VFHPVATTANGRRLQGFLPQLDEFYFTTAEKKIFGNLQAHCSEFQE